MDASQRIFAATQAIAEAVGLEKDLDLPPQWKGLNHDEREIRRLEMLAAGVAAGVKVAQPTRKKSTSRSKKDGDSS